MPLTSSLSAGEADPQASEGGTVKPRSVYEAGWNEACRFKWIASEQARRDLGESAIRLWVREHWNGFLRARWVEHLYGRSFWLELDQNDFGLLTREFRDSSLLRPILDQLIQRKENLDVICWAQAEYEAGRISSVDDVLEILEALDINSRRLEFQLENRLDDPDPR